MTETEDRKAAASAWFQDLRDRLERLADAVENAFDIDALLSYLYGTSFGQARKQ